MNRRKFLTACSFCAIGLLFPWRNENIYALEHVIVDLVQHCNLGCKYCSHFAPLAEKEFYNIEIFQKDIARLAKLCNKNLRTLALLGGEPLLHPKINSFFDISRKYFPYTNIVLVTNAILLDKMPESFWKTLQRNNIYLGPTIYKISGINWESIYNKSVKYNIPIAALWQKHIYNSAKEIVNFKVENFEKIILDIDGKQDNTIHCRHYGRQLSIYNGKLYPCSTIANIRHFNKKFNKNIPVTEKDYIDIYKVKSSKEINDFIHSNIPFCKYCHGSSLESKVKWETAKEHDISEWT